MPPCGGYAAHSQHQALRSAAHPITRNSSVKRIRLRKVLGVHGFEKRRLSQISVIYAAWLSKRRLMVSRSQSTKTIELLFSMDAQRQCISENCVWTRQPNCRTQSHDRCFNPGNR